MVEEKKLPIFITFCLFRVGQDFWGGGQPNDVFSEKANRLAIFAIFALLKRLKVQALFKKSRFFVKNFGENAFYGVKMMYMGFVAFPGQNSV